MVKYDLSERESKHTFTVPMCEQEHMELLILRVCGPETSSSVVSQERVTSLQSRSFHWDLGITRQARQASWIGLIAYHDTWLFYMGIGDRNAGIPCGSGFSPSTMSISGIKFSSLSLAAGAFAN